MRDLAFIFGVAGIVLLAFSLLDWTIERESDIYWTEREARRRTDWQDRY